MLARSVPEGTPAVRIRMKAVITGTRDGEPWPLPGEELTLPDAEGAQLCAQGQADPVASEPVVERATAPAGEKRTRKPKSTT